VLDLAHIFIGINKVSSVKKIPSLRKMRQEGRRLMSLRPGWVT
jgi:hypothetical protein